MDFQVKKKKILLKNIDYDFIDSNNHATKKAQASNNGVDACVTLMWNCSF